MALFLALLCSTGGVLYYAATGISTNSICTEHISVTSYSKAPVLPYQLAFAKPGNAPPRASSFRDILQRWVRRNTARARPVQIHLLRTVTYDARAPNTSILVALRARSGYGSRVSTFR